MSGSLPDLLSVSIDAPAMPATDIADPVVHVAPSLPTYDMAVAATRHQQSAAVTTSDSVMLTDTHAKTHLLSGGNTIMIVPQVHTVRYGSANSAFHPSWVGK